VKSKGKENEMVEYLFENPELLLMIIGACGLLFIKVRSRWPAHRIDYSNPERLSLYRAAELITRETGASVYASYTWDERGKTGVVDLNDAMPDEVDLVNLIRGSARRAAKLGIEIIEVKR
jgi:hypothetical protein